MMKSDNVVRLCLSTYRYLIRRELPSDFAAVEHLNDQCFGPNRSAKTVYRLREGVAPVSSLCFVAVSGDSLVGSLRFWPVRVGQVSTLMLGPLAVQSTERGNRIGMDLLHMGIKAARHEKWKSIILVGDEPYYARVGFSRMPSGKLSFPGPVDENRVLGLELEPDSLLKLSGAVRQHREMALA